METTPDRARAGAKATGKAAGAGALIVLGTELGLSPPAAAVAACLVVGVLRAALGDRARAMFPALFAGVLALLLSGCAVGPAGMALGRSGTCSGTYTAEYGEDGRLESESCEGDLAWGGAISEQGAAFVTGTFDAARGAVGAVVGAPVGSP